MSSLHHFASLVENALRKPKVSKRRKADRNRYLVEALDPIRFTDQGLMGYFYGSDLYGNWITQFWVTNAVYTGESGSWSGDVPDFTTRLTGQLLLPADGSALTLHLDTDGMASVSINGQEVLSASPTPPGGSAGDVNGDGQVDAVEANIMFQLAYRGGTLVSDIDPMEFNGYGFDLNFAALDFNGDGMIDATDQAALNVELYGSATGSADVTLTLSDSGDPGTFSHGSWVDFELDFGPYNGSTTASVSWSGDWTNDGSGGASSNGGAIPTANLRITPPSAAAVQPAVGVEGVPVSISTKFDDSTAQGFSTSINWGDGTLADPAVTLSHTTAQAGTLTASHTYSHSGTYAATLTLTGPNGTTMTPFMATVTSATPTAPSNLTTTPTPTGQAVLTWTDNSSNETGFSIYVSMDGGNTFDYYDQVPANTTSYQTYDLAPSASYVFDVVAFNDAGSTDSASPVSVTTIDPSANPIGPGPANPTTAPDTTNVSQMNLSWDDIANATQYELQWSSDGGTTFQPLTTVGGSTTSYDAGGLAPATGYTFRIRAWTESGVSSWATTNTQSTPPREASGLTASVNQNHVMLTWSDVAGESGYVIQRNDGGGWSTIGTNEAGSVVFTDSSVQPDGVYSYRVGSLDGSGNPTFGNAIQVALVPASPSDLTVTLDTGPVATLRWTDNSTNESGFTIQGSSDGITFQDIGQVATDVTAYPHPAAFSSYRVIAFNAAGDSTPSNIWGGPAGSPDMSFGSDAQIATDFSTNSDTGAAIAIQKDGKIVRAGTTTVHGVGSDISLARYLPDGSLDPTFGDGGKVVTDTGAASEGAQGIVIEDDGRILVIAHHATTSGGYGDFCMLCYRSDGTLDTDFGQSGKVLLALPSPYYTEQWNAVAIQPGGKILVAGFAFASPTVKQDGTLDYHSDDNAAVMRYNPDGTLDTTFGSGGMTLGGGGYIIGLDTFSDGSFATVGYQSPDGGSANDTITIQVQRYTTGGKHDTSFGDDGKVNASFPDHGIHNWAYGTGITVQDDDRIVATGYYWNTANNYQGVILRYTPSGSPDPTFGSGGIIKPTVAGSPATVGKVNIQPNGRMVFTVGNSARTLGVMRLKDDGSPDTDFGQASLAAIPTGEMTSGTTFLLPDGQIMLSGYGQRSTSGTVDWVTLRFNGDPPATLTAHRTGGKFGATVSDAIKTSGDPTQYLILTNNNNDEHPDDPTKKDYDDHTALIPSNDGSTGDKDLARLTIGRLPAYLNSGSIQLSLSNAANARFFASDGTELSGSDLTLDLSAPSGYLAGLLSHDVDVYVEGLKADPDLVVKAAYVDSSGVERRRDAVHMAVADWTFVGQDNQPLAAVSPVWKDTLLAATQSPSPQIDDPGGAFYKINIEGLGSAFQKTIRVQSDADPNDYYDDTFDPGDPDNTVSADFGVLYSSAGVYDAGSDSETPLTTAERDELKEDLELNSVHNPSGTATLKTGPANNPTDIQSRTLVVRPTVQVTLDSDVVHVGDVISGTASIPKGAGGMDLWSFTVSTNDGQTKTGVGNSIPFTFTATAAGRLDVNVRAIHGAGGQTITLGPLFDGAAVFVLPAGQTIPTYVQQAWDALHVNGVVSNDPISRNRRISQLYAEMFNSGRDLNNPNKPNPFEWYGMAAFASKAAGDGMAQALSFEWAPTTLNGPDPTTLEQGLGDGNWAIFLDMYPQALAYQSGGLAAIQAMRGSNQITPEQLTAWDDIDKGVRQNNPALVWNGSYGLVDVEQRVTLQNVLNRNRTLWQEATSNVFSFFYPIKAPYPRVAVDFNTYVTTLNRVSDGGANLSLDFGDPDSRMSWFTKILLPGWQHGWRAANNQIDVTKLLSGGYNQ